MYMFAIVFVKRKKKVPRGGAGFLAAQRQTCVIFYQGFCIINAGEAMLKTSKKKIPKQTHIIIILQLKDVPRNGNNIIINTGTGEGLHA